MEIEDKFNEIILEYCYNNFLDSFNHFLLNITSNFYISISSMGAKLSLSKADKKDFYFSLEQLKNKGYIKTRSEYKVIQTIYLTLKGVVFYEERFLLKDKVMTSIIIKLLEFIKQIDENERASEKIIEIDDLLESIDFEINIKNKSRLFWTLSVIQDDLVLENSIFYIHNDYLSGKKTIFKFTNLKQRILKKRGYDFLKHQLSLMNPDFFDLFKSELKRKDHIYIEPMHKEGGEAEIHFVFSRDVKELRIAKLFKQPIGRFNKDRIMSEKQKLIEFEHKNIVKFFDKGFFKYENQEYFFFILEYIDGKNLEEIDKKIFNQPFITRIKLLKSILKAEQEFLGNFQAHNDLTLKNIMITTKIKKKEKMVKIIDPGSSRDVPYTEDDDYDLLRIQEELLEFFLKPEELERIGNISELKEMSFIDLKQKIDVFYKEIRTFRSKSSETLWKEQLDKISIGFQNWVKEKLDENINLEINKKRYDGLIADYIFGCIAPNSFSEDLIDFNSDLIKNYIEDYTIIRRSQRYKTPDFACQCDRDNGEEILIYPNGLIYFCLIYNYINPEKPEFSLGYLDSESIEILNVRQHQEKYNAPFSTITWGKLESLLKVLCFIFHPECKIKIVRTPTESFSLELFLPNMIYNGISRALSHRMIGFPSYKKYLGKNKDINIQEFFEYDKITEFIKSIKSIIIEYYQNQADRGYV